MSVRTGPVQRPDGERTEPVRSAAVPTLLAVLGSVCGTLVSDALDKSPTTHLAAAALGAAIPPFVAAAGRFSRLRAGAAAVVTVVALLVTYSGFTLADYAGAAEESTFPLPSRLPPTSPTAAPSASATSTATPLPTEKVTCEGRLCIGVTPTSLHCSSGGCDSPVVVRNAGSRLLHITTIEIDGPAAAGFGHDGECTDRWLRANEKCSIRLAFTPGSGTEARLVIHQNLRGPPTRVALEGDPGGTPPSSSRTPSPDVDLTLFTLPECQVVPGGALSGADVLTIFVAVRNGGPGEVARLVPFALRSDTGLSASGNTAVSTGSSFTGMQVDLRQSSYSRVHHFTAVADPGNVIRERDESNNALRVTVGLPARPELARTVFCTSP